MKNDYYEKCSIAAMQELIRKCPLVDREAGADVDKIRYEICESAHLYASQMCKFMPKPPVGFPRGCRHG